MTYAVVAEGLVKRFGTTVALAGVDLAAREGAVLAVLGPNGAGKTTAVRILATLVRADAGRATVHGHDVARQARQVRRMIGLTGQYASVDENLTGAENLFLIGRLLDLPRRAARQRAAGLLDEFGLADASHRPVAAYSGGMRRRLDLAASLVGRPLVLYLDEPSTGLDPVGRAALWEMIRHLAAGGTTVLLTTQYLEEADQLASDIVVIDQGRVIASGTADELKSRAGHQAVQVRPVHREDRGAITALLLEQTGALPDVQGDLLIAPAAGQSTLARVLRGLADAGVPLSELSVRRPSLDEVFARLTGSGTAVSAGRVPAGHEPGGGTR